MDYYSKSDLLSGQLAISFGVNAYLWDLSVVLPRILRIKLSIYFCEKNDSAMKFGPFKVNAAGKNDENITKINRKMLRIYGKWFG